MVRNCLYYGLIHGLGSVAGEGAAGGDDPVFSGLGAAAASAGLDATGINSQLSFAARQISLRIDGAFCRQVLALFGRFSVAHDDQFIVSILLQVLGYVIEFAFALVVHTPGLADLRHIGEVAIGQLAGLRRRRGWRILHRYLGGRSRRSEAT